MFPDTDRGGTVRSGLRCCPARREPAAALSVFTSYLEA